MRNKNKKFGEILKEERLAKGLTQRQLGELCGFGCPGTTISHYELNRRAPSLETLILLQEKLKINLLERVKNVRSN